jgi:hypothetical protein
MRHSGMRQPRGRFYGLFGENVRLECLRALPAFVSFEKELVRAIEETAVHQRFRR